MTANFMVGEKIRFGRGSGEQTLGEIVKVNPKKLQVRILENRGRGSKVGDIWNVPPAMCVKADGSTPVVKTPEPKTPVVTSTDFAAKAKILGLPADCLGKKVTLRYKEFVIVDIALNRRAYPVIVEGPQGGRYISSVSEVLAALNAPAPTPVITEQCPYKVGTLVQVKSLFGKDRYEFGVIVSTEMINDRVKVLSAHGTYTPSLTDIRVCPKLTEEEIMREIVNCYGSLSPENLTCDGEASRAHVRKREGELWRLLNILFVELGHTVSEEEAYAWERKNPAPDVDGFFKVAVI